MALPVYILACFDNAKALAILSPPESDKRQGIEIHRLTLPAMCSV